MTVLCLLVLIPLLAVQSFAADVVDEGKCGDNVTWMLTSDGTLTISSAGDMHDYDGFGGFPGQQYPAAGHRVGAVCGRIVPVF